MELDPQQKAAVTTDSAKALVIAGAGSGKTRVLVERIAHLIENCKVSPYEILAFTFTRKAAKEMKDRLEQRIGAHARHVTMGTMHAIALRMLRRFGDVLKFRPQHLTVYSEWESAYLLLEVAREVGLFKKTWKVSKAEIDRMVSNYYQFGLDPDPKHPAHKLFHAFSGRCLENNALTYGDLLICLQELVPVLGKYLNIRHILVDEVQDIDPLQWQIINAMYGEFRAALFVVGDVNQSIYAFRGAVPEYLLNHHAQFAVYELTANYRSVPEIVTAGNRLIRCNQRRMGSGMAAIRSDGDARNIEVLSGMDSQRLASWISENAVDAVLARNHVLLKKLSLELRSLGVPHTYIGITTSLVNSEEFRRFHAFLKLLANPYDNFSFLLIRELLGIGDQEYAHLRVEATNAGMSHFQVWSEMEGVFQEFFRSPRNRTYLECAIAEISNMASGAPPYPGHPQWHFIDTNECLGFASSWAKDHPKASIQEYLDWLSTFDVQDEIEEETEGITLCTIHAAKGLEWPTVIVAGCNEGILPSRQSLATGDIEEERRLMYVAMTRARDRLILAVRPEDDPDRTSPRSRFVQEAM